MNSASDDGASATRTFDESTTTATTVANADSNKRPRLESTATSPTSASSSSSSSSSCNSNNNLQINPNRRLPLGTFSSGTSVYRNRLDPSETLQDGGYVGLENLILPETTSVITTTFGSSPFTLTWLEKSVLWGVPELLVVIHREGAPRVGHAMLRPMYRDNNNANKAWYWIPIQPANTTVQLQHAKLFAIRSQQGLRIVVCGSNLSREQWLSDRDVLWVQDVPVGEVTDNDDHDIEDDLLTFLVHLTKCTCVDDQRLVGRRLDALFCGLDWSGCNPFARLVISFPRPAQSSLPRGGWKQLAQSVKTLLKKANPPTLVTAMSGSLGDVQPDFLLQMRAAMMGQTNLQTPPSSTWKQVQGIRCLWPSRETAKSMCLGSARPPDRAYFQTIPKKLRRKVFLDAVPNTSYMNFPLPFAHGKVVLATASNSNIDRDSSSVLYVGSHNFSKKAWGLRNAQPQNIEAGVVLVTTSRAQREEWKQRLPYAIPETTARSKSNYQIASRSGFYRADDENNLWKN